MPPFRTGSIRRLIQIKFQLASSDYETEGMAGIDYVPGVLHRQEIMKEHRIDDPMLRERRP